MSKEFIQYINTIGIKVKIVPVKAYNLIGIVEYYYSPIRYVYLIIITEIQDIDKDIVLQMAFKAINNTIGPDGLMPILLVYSTLSRIVEYNILLSTII